MTDARNLDRHITDEEIDAYWKAQLPDEDEQRIEQHFLDCQPCRARVRVVEDLVSDLRTYAPEPEASRTTTKYLGLAAILLAAVAAFAGWQWMAARAALVEATRVVPPQTAPAQRVDPGASAAPLIVARLAPPTRAAQMPGVRAARGSVLLFVLDTREAGAPGTRFDVSLIGQDRRVALHLPSVASSADGELRVPIDASLLLPGPHTFEITSGIVVVGVPFSMER